MPKNAEFQVRTLNELGRMKANAITEIFDQALNRLVAVVEDATPSRRAMAIVRTKLEEACFFAKKAMASAEANQLDDLAASDASASGPGDKEQR